MRDLDAPSPGQVTVVVELLLQLQGLVARVGLAAPLSVSSYSQYLGERDRKKNQCVKNTKGIPTSFHSEA